MYHYMIVGRYPIKAPLNLSKSAAVCLHLDCMYMLQMFDVDQQLQVQVSSISAALNSPGARWPRFWRVTRVSNPSPGSLRLNLRNGSPQQKDTRHFNTGRSARGREAPSQPAVQLERCFISRSSTLASAPARRGPGWDRCPQGHDLTQCHWR